jgi:hypothetical protein
MSSSAVPMKRVVMAFSFWFRFKVKGKRLTFNLEPLTLNLQNGETLSSILTSHPGDCLSLSTPLPV